MQGMPASVCSMLHSSHDESCWKLARLSLCCMCCIPACSTSCNLRWLSANNLAVRTVEFLGDHLPHGDLIRNLRAAADGCSSLPRRVVMRRLHISGQADFLLHLHAGTSSGSARLCLRAITQNASGPDQSPTAHVTCSTGQTHRSGKTEHAPHESSMVSYRSTSK